jgi:hypothetical protein
MLIECCWSARVGLAEGDDELLEDEEEEEGSAGEDEANDVELLELRRCDIACWCLIQSN